MSEQGRKVYVPVVVSFRDDGVMIPLYLRWEDGRQYKIDRIRHITPAPALKAGGQGDRYTIVVNGFERFLFFERSAESEGRRLGRWFLERK